VCSNLRRLPQVTEDNTKSFSQYVRCSEQDLNMGRPAYIAGELSVERNV
jgi:hypothetical protein